MFFCVFSWLCEVFAWAKIPQTRGANIFWPNDLAVYEDDVIEIHIERVQLFSSKLLSHASMVSRMRLICYILWIELLPNETSKYVIRLFHAVVWDLLFFRWWEVLFFLRHSWQPWLRMCQNSCLELHKCYTIVL